MWIKTMNGMSINTDRCHVIAINREEHTLDAHIVIGGEPVGITIATVGCDEVLMELFERVNIAISMNEPYMDIERTARNILRTHSQESGEDCSIQ